jgi:hypothetical protein
MTAMALARQKPSPYYPPRARWYSPALGAFDGVRRTLALDRLKVNLGPDIDLIQLVAGFFVPGLAFYFRLPGLIGKVALVWTAFLLMMFFLFLGSGWDNLVFGLLLSVHVSGFVLYCTPLLGPSAWNRLLFTLAMLVTIRLIVYSSAQAVMENYVATPLQWKDEAVIVGPIYSMNSIHVGDNIAYNYSSGFAYESETYLRDGAGFAPVLAMPGDRVTFDANSYSVNGVPHPRLEYMPQNGMCVVPEKEWFVWPVVGIQERRYEGESRLTSLLMGMALVREDQIIGKPFNRWFWWSQKIL